MMGEIPFKVATIVLYTCFTIIRAHYRRRAGPDVPRPISSPDGIALRFLVPFEVITLFGHLFFARHLPWMVLLLPGWLRWMGVVLGLVALLLLIWVHHNLGRNFTSSIYLRSAHTLITTGPYRWVRHPMYTAFYILHIATLLLTANWLIGLSWLGGLTLVIAPRIGKEERILARRFGDAYRSYMVLTGKFLPLLKLGWNLRWRSRPGVVQSHAEQIHRPDDLV